MRFFIIPVKIFKNQRKNTESKQRFYKKKGFVIAAGVLAFLVLVSGWMLYRINRVPAVSYCEGVGKFRLEADSKEDREKFFEQFSYKAQEVEVEDITVPCDSLNFEEYNELQKSQGLDLSAYCGKEAKMYTLKLSKSGEDTELFGVLIVYKGKVVAAHITDFIYPACVKGLTE